MRSVILILGVLGGLACGLVGWFQRTELEDAQVEQDVVRAVELFRITSNPATRPWENGEQLTPFEEGVRHVGRLRLAAELLVLGLPLGIAGGVLGFYRKKVPAGVMFLVGATSPVLVGSFGAPIVTKYLVSIVAAAAILLVASLLICFLRPLPRSEDFEETPTPAELEKNMLKEHHLYRQLHDSEPQPD